MITLLIMMIERLIIQMDGGQTVYDDRTLSHKLYRNLFRKPNTKSCSIRPRESRLWSLTTSFFLCLLPTWDQLEKARYIPQRIIEDAPLLVNLPPASPCQPSPIRAYLTSFFFSLYIFPTPLPALEFLPNPSDSG